MLFFAYRSFALHNIKPVHINIRFRNAEQRSANLETRMLQEKYPSYTSYPLKLASD